MGVSFITPEGGTKKDIYSRLGKARKVYRDMNNIWRSIQHSTNTKQKLYQSCVVSTLLYGSEYWRIPKTNITIIRHDTPAQKISWSYELLNRCNKEEQWKLHNYRSPNYLPENLENSRLCGMALGQNQPHVQKPQILQFILNKARIWIHAGTLLTAEQSNGHYRRRGASTSAVRTRQKNITVIEQVFTSMAAFIVTIRWKIGEIIGVFEEIFCCCKLF